MAASFKYLPLMRRPGRSEPYGLGRLNRWQWLCLRINTEPN